MNEIDQKLREDASQSVTSFSEERHVALVKSLERAPARSVELPLRTPRDIRALGAAAILLLIGVVGVFTINRAVEPGTASGEFGAPMRVAERSIVRVQSVASNFSNDPSAPLVKQADDVFSFFAKQISLTESLAITPPRKSQV